MFRTIMWYTVFVISLIFTTPPLLRLKRLKNKLSAEEYAKLAEKYTSEWASLQVRTSGARIKLTGLENIPKEGPVLFVSNHQSNFDIALFLGYVHKPKGFIAKVETLKMPLVRTWMREIRCVFMQRGDMKQSLQAIIDGINILKDGHSIVVFPEGTRSKGDEMGEFKAGSFKLCTKTKVPVIPVTISGSYKLMEQNKNKIKPADVKMVIHPAIDTKTLNADEIAALPETVKNIIQSAI